VEEVKEGVASRSAMMPGPMGPMLKEKAPEVENVVRLWPREETLVSRGSQGFYEGGVLHADSSIFDVFTFPFVVGRAERAFNRPDAVILTVSMAHRYFGNEDPLGKTLLLDNEEEVVVTGIVQDVPENAHFTFDFLLPFPSTVYGTPVNEWNWLSAFYTYVLLLVQLHRR